MGRSLLDFLIPGFESYKESSKDNPALRGYAKDSFLRALGVGKDKQQLENSRRAARLYPIVKPTDSEYLIPYYQENVPGYSGKSYDYGKDESFEDTIPFLIDMMNSKTPRRVNKGEALGGYTEQLDNSFVSPLNPLVTTPRYYENKMPITRADPQGVTWTRAPKTLEGFPQDLVDKATSYVYSNTKNPTWLDNDYAMIIWAEINQQAPDLPLEDKQAFFREMLDIAWAESHMGADYHKAFKEDLPASNRNRQTANMWNAGFNSNRGYGANYDPVDRNEMADYVVNQLINTFKVLENKGLKGQYAHNYHIGPNAEFSQVLLDDYLGKMAGANSIFGDMYSWK